MSYFKQILQDVEADTNNEILDGTNTINSGTNPAYTWEGSATSTLGVALIQVSLKTDVNCTVTVYQSPDGTNWDISDSYTYYYSKGGQSWNIIAVNSYVKVKVVGTRAVDSSYFRLQTALCPIGSADPRSLNSEGRTMTEACIYGEAFGKDAIVSPMQALKVATSTRLVGTIFNGTTIDPNFWTATPSSPGATGSVTQTGGEIILDPSGGNNNTASLVSVRSARYVAANTNFYRAVVRLPAWTTAAGKTTTAKWGPWDLANDGYYFEAVQTNGATTPTLQLRSIRGTTVADAITSFNGELGSSYTLDNNVHTYEVYWTNSTVWYLIDGVLLHKTSASTATLTATTNLKVGASVANSGTHATANKLVVRVASISRLGIADTNPQYFHGTTAATSILKYSAGTLKRVTINDYAAATSTITIYDNSAGSGTPVIAVIKSVTGATPTTLNYEVPFSNGLSIVSTGTWDFTVAYE